MLWARRRKAALARTALACAALLAGVGATAAGLDTGTRTASAAPARTAADTAPTLTRLTFADPPSTVRPKYRWWMPLAYTSDGELAAELREMARAGAGGAEVAAFRPQAPDADSQRFLERYGWGTPTWAHKVETMLAAAKANGLRLDFTIGPRWPATVPTVSDINDPRAAQQLIFSHEFDRGGTTRDGALPDDYNVAPPAGARRTLVAALVARCEKPDCDTQSASPRLLDRASVVDVTSQVDSSGELHYTFPGDASSTYALIAFYQTAAGNSRSGYTATGTNYYVDHLSEAGARASSDFYDSQILTPKARRLIDQIGDADLFEDSLELGDSQKWTWDFANQWRRRRGYSVIPALPALSGIGGAGVTATPFFDFGGGAGTRIREDYRQTWSDLYIANRLDVLREWAHSHGMHTRAQPYGAPIDTPDAGTHIDVPEGESLSFQNNIEDYKLVAAGAHLSGAAVVSDECCAFSGKVWQSTAARSARPSDPHRTGADAANLPAVYRGLAGGVTQVVWHGFPYLTAGDKGSGSQTVWPGMTYGGNTSYSAAFGAKGNPSWRDYRAINDAIARLQLVLRQGRPRFDVGVYWQDFGFENNGDRDIPATSKLLHSDSAMAAAGYTYEYVGADALRSAKATFSDGALFGESSAYKALVLDDQAAMSVDVARRILDSARAGLPVVVVGQAPHRALGFDHAAARDAELRGVIDELLRERHVVRVAAEQDLPAALARLDVHAAAAHASSSPAVLSVRRHSANADYYYLYNQRTTAADERLTLTGNGVPFKLDPWTGKITRIASYREHDGRVTVPVHLHGDDVEVIAIAPRDDPTFRGAPATGGAPAPASTAKLKPLPLTDWSLSVDSWTPAASDLPGDTRHTTLGPVRPVAAADGTLPAWSSIDPAHGYAADLDDVAGIGTYTTRFELGSDWSAVHEARLSLGRVVDTARVTINGHALPPLDALDLDHIEVGRYLRRGQNTITVSVASTLLNAVRVAPGTGASGRSRMEYGLLGPVTLKPTTPVTIEALEHALPLARGGFNRAQVRVVNNAAEAQQVTLSATAPDGVSARLDPAHTRLAPGEAATIAVELREREDGPSSGTSSLTVTARGAHGAVEKATVRLTHSDDLARNDLDAPFPRAFASSNQDHYPPQLIDDGDPSTFWVSGGFATGQGPSGADPVMVGVDLGAPTEVSAVTAVGRSSFGPRTYDVQTSDDARTWHTVAHVTDAPEAGASSGFETVTARYVRLRITDSWDSERPPRNVQMAALEVYGAPFANHVRTATLSASSTHSGFPVSTLADGETSEAAWCSRQTGHGWNDATSGAFPDTVTATFQHPVEVGRAVVYTLDSACRYGGVADYDLQALVGGEFETVATVRGNSAARVESTFAPVDASALRIVVLDSRTHDYSRLVELEAYGP